MPERIENRMVVDSEWECAGKPVETTDTTDNYSKRPR